jgi:hypothetical protein
MKRWEDALKDFAARERAHPSAYNFYLKSKVHQTQGDLKQAIADVDEGLKIYPKSPILFETKGDLPLRNS